MELADRRRMTSAEICTALFFAVLGIGLAGWAPRVPDIKMQLGLSDTELGAVLLAVALGSMIFMPVTGLLIGRFGCQRVLWGSGAAFSLALMLPALARDLPSLAVALAILGAALGALDVSANAEAAARERAGGRQIMGKCHGCYSVGAIAGAIAGGLAAQAGISVLVHFLVMGVLLAAAGLLLACGIPAEEVGEATGTADGPRPGELVLPSPALWGLGAIAFCALMVEGAMLDWSAVYLREHVSADPFMAGAGFALFSAGMAAGRLVCDRVSEARGRLFVIRAGAVLAAFGMGFALLQDTPVWAVAGFVIFGFGLSGILPVMFSIAGGGKAGMPPGAAIAALATTAYTGLLIGPALIGMVAGVIGLPSALMMLPALMLLITVAAGVLPIIRSQSYQLAASAQ